MLKVLIADDEKKVCRLIQMLCDWQSLEMELVGFAYNGIQALEMIHTCHPDILITDIRMPGCDGIEIIRKVREEAVSVEILIISGYADFNYAQSAIRYGVSDYLLKPIKKQELQNTLIEIGVRCRQEKARLDESSQLLQYVEDDRIRRRCSIFSKLLLAVPQRVIPEMKELNQQYSYCFKPGYFRIMILKLDYNRKRYDEQAVRKIMDGMEEKIRITLSQCCDELEIYSDGCISYIICNYPEAASFKFRQAIRSSVDQIMIKRFQLRENSFSFGMGRYVEDSRELLQSLADAQNAIKERLLEGGEKLLEAPIRKHVDFSDSIGTFNHDCAQAIEILDEKLLHSQIEQLKTELFREEDLTGSDVYNVVNSVGIHALTLRKEEHNQLLSEFAEECDMCSTADQLFELLEKTLCQLIKDSIQKSDEEGRRPIRIARQYIQNHYTESISLEMVAEKAGFSCNYFSSVFKKEVGVGFADYVGQLRMEKAKELLVGTKVSIKDICDQVGYSDLKHFTALFRKYTSMKPGEYRKLYG